MVLVPPALGWLSQGPDRARSVRGGREWWPANRTKYHSETTVTADGSRHDHIHLVPANPAVMPITLEPEEAGDLTIIGEFTAFLVPS